MGLAKSIDSSCARCGTCRPRRHSAAQASSGPWGAQETWHVPTQPTPESTTSTDEESTGQSVGFALFRPNTWYHKQESERQRRQREKEEQQESQSVPVIRWARGSQRCEPFLVEEVAHCNEPLRCWHASNLLLWAMQCLVGFSRTSEVVVYEYGPCMPMHAGP